MGDDTDATFPEQLGILRRLATYKYDDYQQYTPGRQFVESLARWLGQFHDSAERGDALRFVLQRLVYLSDAEMRHLVSLMVRDLVPKRVQRLIADRLNIPWYRTAAIRGTTDFRRATRASLFLGMSDGARIDQFRRNDATLSNEQFAITYELSEARAHSMLKELRKDLNDTAATFDHIFLIDDFAGSGRTIIRRSEDGAFDGRLVRFIDDTLCKLSGGSCPRVFICLYLATDLALDHIRSMIEAYPEPPWSADNVPEVMAVMTLDHRFRLLHDRSEEGYDTDQRFDLLLHKYYDARVQDEHKKVVVHGYSDCGLPLVLPHNTPNNSVYLLWEKDRTLPLFPRFERHHARERGD